MATLLDQLQNGLVIAEGDGLKFDEIVDDFSSTTCAHLALDVKVTNDNVSRIYEGEWRMRGLRQLNRRPSNLPVVAKLPKQRCIVVKRESCKAIRGRINGVSADDGKGRDTMAAGVELQS